MERHKTHKNAVVEPLGEEKPTDDSLKKLLDGGVRIALQRPWHRIERGLRLGRLRQFIDDVAPQYHMADKDKESFFTFLQKSLDNKLLNTIKVVDYDQETERIRTIKGLEIKRNQEGNLRWAFSSKTIKKEAGTRKKKKPEPSVSTIIESSETKIEEKMEQ
jgi:hypothetical protein